MAGQGGVSDLTWFWWHSIGRTLREVLCLQEGVQELVPNGTYWSSENFTHFLPMLYLCTSGSHFSAQSQWQICCYVAGIQVLIQKWTLFLQTCYNLCIWVLAQTTGGRIGSNGENRLVSDVRNRNLLPS